jgi:serine/threonine-protein kinase HipA
VTLELSAAKDVTTAEVRKAGHLAATLQRTADGVLFTYVEGYDGPPVATTLPLDIGPVQRPGGALPAYFAGLLPEGRRLGALRRAVKTSVDDELSLLLAVGADTIGDVQVVPADTEAVVAPPRVSLDATIPLSFRHLLAELDVLPDRRGLPGVQEKVSAAMITVPVTRTGSEWILKLDPPEFPGLTANEAVLLRACVRSGLDAAHGELVHDTDGATGLAILRFDRTSTGPLAVEDGCQVSGRTPGDKYVLGYPATFRALAAVCDARALALRTLLAQLTFAVLTGNGDAHAKNFSVLQQPDGEWRVSPAYDVPTSQPYGDTTLAMPINGRHRDVGAKDLLALATEVGLPERAARRVLQNATDRVDDWLPLLDELPYDRGRRTKLARVVAQRRRRLMPN